MKDDRWRWKRWMIHIKDDKMKDDIGGQERWMMNDGKKRHDIFPEDNILDIITISRYNYHM